MSRRWTSFAVREKRAPSFSWASTNHSVLALERSVPFMAGNGRGTGRPRVLKFDGMAALQPLLVAGEQIRRLRRAQSRCTAT